MIADRDLMLEDVFEEILNKAISLLPPEGKGEDKPEVLRKQLFKLRRLAEKVPNLSECRHHGLYLTPEPPQLGSVPLCTEGVPGKQLVRWRSIRTNHLLVKESEKYGSKAQSVREIERDLAVRWGQRILNRLLPAADSFPNLQRAVKSQDKDGLLDIFGQARWSTLAQHGRNLDIILDLMPNFVPWSTDKVAILFDNMRRANEVRDKPWTPNKPNAIWSTIYFLSSALGVEDELEMSYLKNKKDALRARFVTSYETEDHRAHCPPMEVIMALEKASAEELLWLDRWFSSALRHVTGASGRFNDYIHTHSSSFEESDRTLELRAWQTKVTDLLDKKRQMPLIAPKVSFSGTPWWTTFSEGMKHLEKLMGPRDFVIPAPNRDHTGVLPAPLRNSKALNWYREILRRQKIPNETVMKMTLSGLRVFMADLAYRIQVPRDLRRYIGRWASDSMADIYTRDHREVVVKIWDQVKTSLGTSSAGTAPLNPEPDQPVPVNLSAGHYNLAEEIVDTPVLPTLPMQDLEQEYDVDWAEVTGHGGLHNPSPPRSVTRMKETTRILIDTVGPDKGGPLQVITNNFGTGNPPVKKVHLCRPTRRCVCGYKPAAHRIDLWTVCDEWNVVAHDYIACWSCFRQYQLPPEWLDPSDEALPDVFDVASTLESPVSNNGEGSTDSSETDPVTDSSDPETTIKATTPGLPDATSSSSTPANG